MTLEYLPWDSEFFIKKIGIISYTKSEEEHLVKLIEVAAINDYQLLYIFSPENLYIGQDILVNYSGKLIDRKIVYSQKISDLNIKQYSHSPLITEYLSSEVSKELESLAYLSGIHSRFHTDNGFTDNDFHRLYKIWIEKSLTKKMANKVFVVKEKDVVVGMSTLKYSENKGEIGLIAINGSVQGKGYGRLLIETCIIDLISKNIFEIEVSTQIKNEIACQFYQKCGFKEKITTNIYHFWL